MGVHANLLIACTQVAGETGLTGIVIFLTEIEPQHGIQGMWDEQFEFFTAHLIAKLWKNYF